MSACVPHHPLAVYYFVIACLLYEQYALKLDCIIPNQKSFVMEHYITIKLPIVISSNVTSASTRPGSSRLLFVFPAHLFE